MDFTEYFCPNCGAVLNNQPGFDPDNGYWVCTNCGMQLFDEEAYSGERFPDTVWYCDSCGANLSKQSGFSDYYDTWYCTECGHENHIREEEIFDSEQDYQNSNNSDSSDDSEYESDDEENIPDDEEESVAIFPDSVWVCDSCGAVLSEQPGFSEENDYWICTECGYENHIGEAEHSSSGVASGSVAGEKKEPVKENGNESPKKTAKEKQKEDKPKGCLHAIIGFYVFLLKFAFIMLAVLGIIFGALLGYNYVKGARNKIALGISSSDVVGMQHTNAVRYFEKLGFTEVTEKGIPDVTGAELDQEGLVTAVSISGKTEFTADTRVPFNKHIEVIYRTVIPISPPASYKTCRGMDYDAVQKMFEDAGFINIRLDPLQDIKLGWFNDDGEVKEVSIAGDTKFAYDSEWRPDAEVVISYHSSAKDG